MQKSTLLFIATLSLMFSHQSFAERYKVSKDAFGQLDAVQVAETETETDADIDRLETVSPQVEESGSELSESSSDVAQAIDAQERPQEDGSSTGQDTIAEDVQNASETVAGTTQNEEATGAPAEESQPKKKLSIFEQKYLESWEREKQEILDLMKEKEGENQFDATDVSGEKFADGDLLEKSGEILDKSRAPYFIEIDADGRPRITAYDPVLEKAFRENQRRKKFEFTDATIFKRSQEEKSYLNLPGAIDPKLKEIFSAERDGFEDYFTSFSKSCCEQLINKNLETMEKGRAYFFELTEDDLMYRFSEGDSRYLLVKLPRSTNKNYPLRFRTFVRDFKKKGISQAVFFPQIVTLNQYKEPQRIITGPLLKYVPETWAKYGFLEGVFEIDQTRENEEVYLLAKTNRKILKQNSVIESQDSSVTLNHIGYGSFEIEILID